MKNTKTILLQFVRQHWGKVGLTFLLTLGASLFNVLLPIAIAGGYELVFPIQSVKANIVQSVIPFKINSWTLHQYLWALTLLLFGKGLLDFGQRFWIAKLGEIHVKDLRERLFQHQLGLSMNLYETKGTGRYLLRYSGDLTSVQSYLSKGVIRFLSDLILVLLTVFFIFTLNPLVAKIILGLLLLMVTGFYFINKELHIASEQRRNTKSGLLSFVSERLQAILTIQGFNREVPEQKRFVKKSTRLFWRNLRYHRINAFIGSVIPIGLYGIIILLFTLGAQQVKAGTLLIIVLLFITLQTVFRRLFRVGPIWKRGEISYRKLILVLNTPSVNQNNCPSFKYKKGDIQIKNLSFAYPHQSPLFKDWSLHIPSKQIAVIKGNGACGKTTLVKLLTGIYQPTGGQILIDEQPIDQLNKKSLRRKVTVVNEDWKLLGKTVFESISYSKKRSLKPKVQFFFQEMQQKFPVLEQLELDSSIGEYGKRLSNSQRKMLLILRALLTKKPILILDEPFNNLNQQEITALCDLLSQFRASKTILLLTNKPIPPSLAESKPLYFAIQKESSLLVC